MIKYTKEYINELLNKFMAGTSTLEEEDILSQYFAQSRIPAEWESYRLLFAELETMKPVTKPKRRWIGWSVAAAAIVAGILYLAAPSQQEEHPQGGVLVAHADTTSTVTVNPDTMPQRKEEPKPMQTKKRSTRKKEPTIHDIDKAYALLAQMEQAKNQAEQAKAQLELFDAQMAAHGYVPVMQEDGTITYMNEQETLIAYEE